MNDVATLTNKVESIEQALIEMRALLEKIASHRQEETYLTTEEACAIFKISASTLFARKREGRIDYWQDGRIVRWPKSALAKIAKYRN